MSDTEETLTKPKALKPRSPAQIAATEKMKQARQAKITEKKTVIPEGKTLSKLEQKKLYLQAVKEKLNKTPKRQETEPDKKYFVLEESESEVEESEVESEPEPQPAPKPKPKAKAPVKTTAKKSIKNKTPAVHIPSESEESEAEEVIVVKKSKKPKKPKKKTIIIEESSDDDEGHTDSDEDEPAPVYKAPTRATKSQKHKSSTNRGPPAPVVERPQYQFYFG
jgi:hypothetical protein